MIRAIVRVVTALLMHRRQGLDWFSNRSHTIHFSPRSTSTGTIEPQYVITLTGTLEFTMRDGKTFVLRPSDVLIGPITSARPHR